MTQITCLTTFVEEQDQDAIAVMYISAFVMRIFDLILPEPPCDRRFSLTTKHLILTVAFL